MLCHNSNMKTIKTIAGQTYVITSPNGCTVTDNTGVLLATVSAGVQQAVVATGGELSVSDEAALITAVFKFAPALNGLSSGGGNTAAAAGERTVELTSDSLSMSHGIWYINSSAESTLQVAASNLTGYVVTCYVVSEVPVTLNGVEWLDGSETTMTEGSLNVVALQQIEGRIIANLAYTV